MEVLTEIHIQIKNKFAMKKYLLIISFVISVMFAFSSCQKEEIVQNPEFTLYDASNEVVLSTVAANQYKLDLTYFEYSASTNELNEILASDKFAINSNVKWRMIPAEDEEYSWIRPFPDNGSDKGQLIFVCKRNNDTENDRTAYFKVIINDGQQDKEVDGMIVITQSKAVDFLKVNKANLTINADDLANQTITVTSNVEWKYEIVPDEQYATADLSWLKDNSEEVVQGSISRKLKFQASDNSNGTIRGAILNISVPSDENLNKTIPITQFGKDVEASGFPVAWKIAVSGNNYAETWPASGTIEAVQNAGTIKYVPADNKAEVDVNKKYLLDVSANCPRATGVWPGDYCEFKADAPVSTGAIMSIMFETRVSGTGHKYWRLEYKDGSEWKVVGKAKNITIEGQGDIVYTHEMAADGSTNILVNETVKYQNTTDEAVFRFICAANYQANGSGPLAAPNGGTWRLAVTDVKTKDTNPVIKCVAAGTEDLTPSNIVVKGVDNNVITFEGAPEKNVEFTVNADNDFTIDSNVSWLHLDKASGNADEDVVISLSCDPSELSESRRGNITIKAGITKYTLSVIQSAAGGALEPLISIVGSNYQTVLGEGEEFSVKVQSNVQYQVETSDWISEVPAVSTKSIVETKEYRFKAAVNVSGELRKGFVRFYAGDIESVLNVTQENFEPRVDISAPFTCAVSGAGCTVNYNVDANIPFEISTDASWITLPAASAMAGVYSVPVVFAANPDAAQRSAEITITNTEYAYSKKITVNQFAAGVVFFDDFEWLDPWSVAGDGKGQTAGRTVETGDLGAYAPQLPTPKVNGVSALQALENKGYEFTRWNKGTLTTSECIYLQQNYLKVGKTGYHAAIKLPSMAASTQTAALTFDWCPMKQGSGKVDPVNLLVVVENGSESTTFTVPTHGWENNHVLEWIHASVDLSSVSLTEKTRITIRQTDEENNAGTANRWFIDNIKVQVL